MVNRTDRCALFSVSVEMDVVSGGDRLSEKIVVSYFTFNLNFEQRGSSSLGCGSEQSLPDYRHILGIWSS